MPGQHKTATMLFVTFIFLRKAATTLAGKIHEICINTRSYAINKNIKGI